MYFKDLCDKCPDTFGCELKLDGHGYKRERKNVAKLVECQMDHRDVIPDGSDTHEKEY